MSKNILLLTFIVGLFCCSAFAQAYIFTYQGKLNDGGVPANGLYDIRITQLEAIDQKTGSDTIFEDVQVTNGIFTVNLTTGALILIENRLRFIEIGIRPGASSGSFTVLSPRQPVYMVPYAGRSATAAEANYAVQATNSDNAEYAVTAGTITGILPIENGGTGSPTKNFVDLTTDQIVSGNKTFAGNLTVNGTLNANLPPGSGSYIQNSTTKQASSDFNISGTGTSNIFNALTQFNIGGTRVLGISGGNNVFAGLLAGNGNTSGEFNTFLGSQAGFGNTTSSFNTFLGAWSGIPNTGSNNTFVGALTGNSNQSGSNNAFIGSSAGSLNTSGSSNAFVGLYAGLDNTTGSNNSFLGRSSGSLNVTGSNITAVGSSANVSSGALTNSTAIGANALVSQSNSLVLGSINGINGATADTNVGIGTTAPAYRLDVQGRIRLRQPLPTVATNTAGLFLARNDAVNNPIETAFIGMRDDTSVGLYGAASGWGLVMNTTTGATSILILGSAGSTTLCRNGFNEIATCSSSIRYKNNINNFNSGLDLIRKLRPVSFRWNQGRTADMGLVAEEVAAIEPLLTTTDAKGQIEGVKYDRIGVIAVNAIKEQQSQIEAQQTRITELEAELKALKALICSANETSATCKESK